MNRVEFEKRVLEEACDPRNPVLERLKFLGILGRNLDEFVMVRGREWVGSPEARRLIRRTYAMLREGDRVLRRELLPILADAGVHVRDYAALTPAQRADVDARFMERLFPLITPLSCDAAGPSNVRALGLNFVVVVEEPEPVHGACLGDRSHLFIVRVPDQVSSLVPVDAAAGVFVWLRDVIAANLHQLFPGARVRCAHRFRIVRDAGLALDSGDADMLPRRTLNAVRQRERNPVLMLAIERAAAPSLVERLACALEVQPAAIVRPRDVLDFKRLWDFSHVERADLRYPAFVPRLSPRVGPCMFAAIRAHDILLHHPFESFEPVLRLARQAGADPAVERISATIYRTDTEEPPLVDALLAAARRGKDVRVLVELKARFDEQRNAEWACALTAAGARVMYSRPGLKVHAKMLLVERREAHRLRRYAHLSSGNYNASTSLAYTDLALLTCDEAITSDVAEIFESLGAEPQVPSVRSVIAAPFGLRRGFRELVEREIAWARSGEPGHIILKMNALLDDAAIELLHRASQAGVQVDLIVRGLCALRPGVPGSSDRIRVRSIVGRFLEHSRAWYFRNGGSEEVFIGSADLRPRNFDTRVEIMVPIRERALVHRLRYEILATYLLDTQSARELLPNGRYRRASARQHDVDIGCQSAFLDLEFSSAHGSRGDRDRHGSSHLPGGHAGARTVCVG